jgi:hypothetical protein
VKSSYSERVLQTWSRYNSTNLCAMYQDNELNQPEKVLDSFRAYEQ